MEKYPKYKSITDLVMALPTERAMYDYLVCMRWGDKPICPKCEEQIDQKYYPITRDPEMLIGSKCKHRFSVKKGTIFEKSNIHIVQWFHMMFEFCLIHSSSNISSDRFSIEQKTAWELFMKLCHVVKDEEKRKLKGKVEVDEYEYGPDIGQDLRKRYKKINHDKREKRLNEKYGKPIVPYQNTFPIFGMRERGIAKRKTKNSPAVPGGNLVVKYVPDKSMDTLGKCMIKTIDENSIIFSDGWDSYDFCHWWFKNHYVINRSESKLYDFSRYYRRVHWFTREPATKEEIENGKSVVVTTNSLENNWWGIQRQLLGSFGVSKEFMQQYLNAYMFRFNRRHLEPGERFVELFQKCLTTPPVKLKSKFELVNRKWTNRKKRKPK